MALGGFAAILMGWDALLHKLDLVIAGARAARFFFLILLRYWLLPGCVRVLGSVVKANVLPA